MTDTPKKPARLAQAAPQMPSVGRIVIFEGTPAGKSFAGIITGVSETADMTVNLSVFPDGRWAEGYVARRENVPYSAAGEMGTWRWPARL